MYVHRSAGQNRKGIKGGIRTFAQFAQELTSPNLPPNVLQGTAGLGFVAKMVDAGVGGGLILILYNRDHASSAVENATWLFVDGTFNSRPEVHGVHQLVTFMADVKHKVR